MKTAVLGAGSWGTALAVHLERSGHHVRLWARETEITEAIQQRHENPVYLPGCALPVAIEATSDLAEAVQDAETVLIVIPSQFCRDVYRQLSAFIPSGAVVLSATKGIECETLRRMSEVAGDEMGGHPVAVLSGPSFAVEVYQEQPTAIVVAAEDLQLAESLQRVLSTRALRAYASDDVIGVELAGALKNVIAIAAGIVNGLGYGHNTVAALITRGLAEITRLAVACGARADTLSGLAGLGDLVLTCTGGLSRNRRLGQALGAGRTLSDVVGQTQQVAEGVPTTRAACAIADKLGVDMPIARQMQAVLYQDKPPRDAVAELMLRTLKRE